MFPVGEKRSLVPSLPVGVFEAQIILALAVSFHFLSVFYIFHFFTVITREMWSRIRKTTLKLLTSEFNVVIQQILSNLVLIKIVLFTLYYCASHVHVYLKS